MGLIQGSQARGFYLTGQQTFCTIRTLNHQFNLMCSIKSSNSNSQAPFSRLKNSVNNVANANLQKGKRKEKTVDLTRVIAFVNVSVSLNMTPATVKDQVTIRKKSANCLRSEILRFCIGIKSKYSTLKYEMQKQQAIANSNLIYFPIRMVICIPLPVSEAMPRNFTNLLRKEMKREFS